MNKTKNANDDNSEQQQSQIIPQELSMKINMVNKISQPVHQLGNMIRKR